MRLNVWMEKNMGRRRYNAVTSLEGGHGGGAVLSEDGKRNGMSI